MITASQSPATLMDLAGVFARFGNFTFGGGSATIAVLRDEIVTRRRWVDTLAVDLSFALSRITPGTNLLAFCTAVGWLIRGWRGAAVALVAGSAPSSAIALALTFLFNYWSENPYARVAMRGALAAAVAVMAITGWTLLRPYYKARAVPLILIISGGAFVLEYFASVPPFRILLIAAVAGLFLPEDKTK